MFFSSTEVAEGAAAQEPARARAAKWAASTASELADKKDEWSPTCTERKIKIPSNHGKQLRKGLQPDGSWYLEIGRLQLVEAQLVQVLVANRLAAFFRFSTSILHQLPCRFGSSQPIHEPVSDPRRHMIHEL